MPSRAGTGKVSPEQCGPALALPVVMQLNLDYDQFRVLREILEASLNQLRVESARADLHDAREVLHRRERAVEALLRQLGEEPRTHL